MDRSEQDGALVTASDPRVERFTHLFRLHIDDVRRFARRRVGADLGDEVTAATFLVAWRRLESVPEVALPWLYRVAGYEIANLRRKEEARERAHLAMAAETTVSGEIADEDEGSDRLEQLRRAFAHLSERDQETLRLVAWEELSPAEGGQVLGCSAATFRVRLHRARRRLAAEMETAFDGVSPVVSGHSEVAQRVSEQTEVNS